MGNMLKLGVIEPSRSPWASPCLLVKKKDGSERFVNDFRALNEQEMLLESFPYPSQDR